MNLLLDSHVLVWYDDPARLSTELRRQIETAGRVFVSAATVWELTMKQHAGKLRLPRSIRQVAAFWGFTLLDLTAAHAELAGSLPLHHRDPFDRMLVAQAKLDALTLVTHDATLAQYDVPLLRV